MKFIDFKGENVRYVRGKRIDYKKPKIDIKTSKIKEPKFRFWLIIKIGIVLAILVALSWWLFFSGVFNIREITIKGEAGAETMDAINALYGKNIFWLGGKRAEENLKQKQPGIKAIQIIRGLPSTIKIELVERESTLTWRSQDKLYLVDSEGVVFKQIDKPRHFLIADLDNIEIKPGRQILDKDFIEFVKLANQEIPLRTEFKIDHFEIQESTYQVFALAENGRKIILNSMRQINPQIEALKKTWNERQDEIAEYIDLRVEGMVYYK